MKKNEDIADDEDIYVDDTEKIRYISISRLEELINTGLLNIEKTGGAFGLRTPKLDRYKETLTLTDEQKDILTGTLLGDASMSLANKEPQYSVKFEQSLIKRRYEYVDHLFEKFRDFVGTGPRIQYYKPTKNLPKRVKSSWFRTVEHVSLKKFWHRYYIIEKNPEKNTFDKTKVVPSDIDQYLNARALAYWFMDDGGYNLNRYKVDYLLHTHGFTVNDCEVLCKALKSCFNIKATLQSDKGKKRIFITAERRDLFKKLISPYILDCFKYKLEGKVVDN